MRNGLLLLLAVGHGAAFTNMFNVTTEEILTIKHSIAAAKATSVVQDRSVDALQEVDSRRRLGFSSARTETNADGSLRRGSGLIATLKCKPMDACGGHQSCVILPEPESGSIDFFDIQSSAPTVRYTNRDGGTFTFTFSGECQIVYTSKLQLEYVLVNIDHELCLGFETYNSGFFRRDTTLGVQGVVNHRWNWKEKDIGSDSGVEPRQAVLQAHVMTGSCTIVGNIVLVAAIPVAIIVIISITIYCICKKKKRKKEQKAVSPAASPQPPVPQGVPMQPMQTSPPPVAKAGSSGGINVAKLKELKELLDNGVLTQAEFDAQKKALLADVGC